MSEGVNFGQGEMIPYSEPATQCLPALRQQSLVPSEHELQVYQAVAKQAYDSKYYQKLAGTGGVAALVSIMLYAREVNVPAMTSLSGAFNNIDGKIEASAGLIAQKIREAGHSIKILESSDTVCTIWGKRYDTQEEFTASVTIEYANRAGWARRKRRADGTEYDGTWQKHPDDMLFNRCISKLKRRLFPEVLAGAYAAGEIRESIDVEVSAPRSTRQKPQPKPAASNAKVFPDEPPAGEPEQPATPPDEPVRPMPGTSSLRPEVAKKLKMCEAYLKGIKVNGANYTPEEIDTAFRLLFQHFQIIEPNDLTDEQLAQVMPLVKSREFQAGLREADSGN